MSPFEQTIIMFGILIGITLVGFGIYKGLSWLWEKLKQLAGPTAAATAALVVIVAGHGSTPQQEDFARQQVQQLQAQGIEAQIITIDEDQARQLVEEARREGLIVETHDPVPSSTVSTGGVIVIQGDESAVEDLDADTDPVEDDSFLSEDERRYREDERRGLVSSMDW